MNKNLMILAGEILTAAVIYIVVNTFLPQNFCVITAHLQLKQRKIIKFALNFLQKHDIRLIYAQPVR